MAERSLEGKTVLMTGAGRGMGRQMAIALAGAGAKVAMIDIDEDVLNEAAKAAEDAGGQGSVKPFVCDVTDADRAKSTADEIVAALGSLDVLVNDAVIGPERIPGFMTQKSRFWELGDDLWNAMLRVNIFGPQLMAKTCAPYMIEKGWGRIVNVTTSLDTMYLAGAGAYGPTKAALEAHTLVMSQDLEGTGVSANVLVPGGMVNTRMIPEESGIPREKLIQPNVMENPIRWLASEASDGITGMRFIGALWDESLPLDRRIEQAGAPCAWTQLPSKAIYPD
ncbi:MAG: SDR family NAD(P)-dependent oxidoreductase [Alphaproteobacteria bacterium]